MTHYTSKQIWKRLKWVITTRCRSAARGEPVEGGAVLQRRPGENRPAIPAEPQEGRQRRGRAAGRHAGAAGNVAVTMRRYETHPENGLAMMRGRFSVSGNDVCSAKRKRARMRAKLLRWDEKIVTSQIFIKSSYRSIS